MEIGALGQGDAQGALDVLARGMRDNPIHIVVFGSDPNLRERKLRRLFGGAFDAMGWGENMLAARDAEGAILGVCGALPPGRCRLEFGQQLRMMPRLLSTGPVVSLRAMRWLGVWASTATPTSATGTSARSRWTPISRAGASDLG